LNKGDENAGGEKKWEIGMNYWKKK
jgi:hypothetical protein